MINLNIKATNLDLDQEIKSYIEEKIGTLDKFFPKIISGAVEVELTTHHQTGDIYRAEVNLRIPKKLIRVEKIEPNIFKAIDKVKDHLRQDILRHKSKMITKGRQARGKE